MVADCLKGLRCLTKKVIFLPFFIAGEEAPYIECEIDKRKEQLRECLSSEVSYSLVLNYSNFFHGFKYIIFLL